MNKIISINLNGTVFQIDEKAYQILKNYLDSIKEYFESYEDNIEIINDIESRLAEKLHDVISARKEKTVFEKDIQDLIDSMGKVEDIAQETEEAEENKVSQTPQKNQTTYKRLYRVSQEGIVGGVSIGIGNYFSIDPTFIRLAFVILTFFSGTGLLVYGLLWLLLPDAKTNGQQVEMTEGTVTLSSLKKKIESAADEVKNDSAFVKTSRSFFSGVRSFLVGIIRLFSLGLQLIFRLAGFGMVIGSIFSFAGLTFAAGFFSLKLFGDYIEPEALELVSVIPTPLYYGMIAAVFIIVFVPILVKSMIGLSLLFWKNFLRLQILIPLFFVWILALVSVGLSGTKFAPQLRTKYLEIENRLEYENQAQVIEKTFDVTEFSDISISGYPKVTIAKGEKFGVLAKGTEIALSDLVINQEEKKLFVELDKHRDNPDRVCIFFCDEADVVLEITAPQLSSLQTNNYSKAVFVDTFVADTFSATALGSSKIELMIESQTSNFVTEGFSKIEAEGFSNTLDLSMSGSSKSDLETFKTASVSALIEDFSQVELGEVSNQLDLTMDGSSYFELDSGLISTATIKLSDFAKAAIEGTFDIVELQTRGSTQVDLSDSVVGTLNLDLEDFSSVNVVVTELIQGKVKDSASLNYDGSADIDVETSDFGSIKENIL